jgi:uncharacterized protein (TIGR00156 family)
MPVHRSTVRNLTLFLVLGTALGAALAQYVGPSTVKLPATVAEVLKTPVDDQEVVLRGRIVEKLTKDKYRFVDSSGEIRVEIDLEDFRGQTVSDTTVVEIRGEVEKDFVKSPEIDVKRLTVVTQ